MRTRAGEELLSAAERLAPDILAVRDEIDRERCLPPVLVEMMRTSGLFKLWLPRALGGPELHPLEFIRVIEALAKADGSVAWCATNASVFSLLAGHMQEPSARAVFGADAVVAGSINPQGIVIPVDGGYLVSGRWAYASGIGHCDWVLGNCLLAEDDQPARRGPREMRFVLMPKAAGTVFDAWNVSGLRGTGSHDFRVDEVFVPAGQTVPAFAVASVQAGTLYRMPPMSLFTIALASVSLGIARAAIEALVELAAGKTPMGSAVLLREVPSAQAAVGKAEALLRAARASVMQAVAEQWDEVAAAAPSLARRAGVKLATTFCANACAQAVDAVHEAAGGSALFESGRIARCWRDVHAATQHIGLSAGNYELAGRVLFGLDLGTPRF